MTKMEIILKNKKLKLQMFLIIHFTKRMDAQTLKSFSLGNKSKTVQT